MKPAALVTLILALASCRGGSEGPARPDAGPLATVVRSGGTVWRAGADGSRAPIGDGIAAGEAIVTGEDGQAVVVLAPGRELELGPGARLKLRQEPGGLVPEIESGRIVSRSNAGPSDVVLTVLTPFGITRVPAGRSEVSIGVDKNGVHIDVTLGEIAFVDAAGKTVTAGAHDTVNVTVGHVEVVHPTAPAAPEPLDVMLSSEIGPLLVRAPGEQRLYPRRAAPAPAGTAFRVVAPRGRARLVAPGLRARLNGNAVGRVDAATRSDEGRRFDLSLDRGSAIVSLEGGQAHELVLARQGRPPVTLRTTSASTFSIDVDGARSIVAVLVGSADLMVGQTRRRLGANDRAAVAGTEVAVTARPPSDVVLPTARDLHVYADGLSDVTLSWPGPIDTGLVEIASDPEFKDMLLAGRVVGRSVTVPAPRRADLYWRVTGRNGERDINGHARFDPDPRRSVLDLEHPHDLVDESGPMTTVYFQGVVPTLTFSYAARPGAARYRVRVFRADALDRPIVERVVQDTRCAVDAKVLTEGSYVWHAVPLDPHGAELGGGRMNKLDLVYDNALTQLAIGSPKPDEIATGSNVAALGVAPLGSKLYINGRLARLDDKGRFAMRVGRAPAVVFRLVDKHGGESYWIRRLRGAS